MVQADIVIKNYKFKKARNMKRYRKEMGANIYPDAKKTTIIFTISREDVESLNISLIVEDLKELIRTPKNIKKYKNNVMMFINGYDDDDRELINIPEAKKFYQKLDKEFPLWIVFIEEIYGCLDTIIAILLGEPKEDNRVEHDLKKLKDFVNSKFVKLNEEKQINLTLNKEISKDIAKKVDFLLKHTVSKSR